MYVVSNYEHNVILRTSIMNIKNWNFDDAPYTLVQFKNLFACTLTTPSQSNNLFVALDANVPRPVLP